MTPLYHRLARRLTLPAKKRELLYDPHGLLNNLSDVHLGAGRNITSGDTCVEIGPSAYVGPATR